MDVTLKIGGRWSHAIAAAGEIGWNTRVQGGVDDIRWSMDVDTRFRDDALRVGSLVELYAGPARIGAGVMLEPDLASGSFEARGLYRLAEDYLCEDAVGAGTSIPNTAIDQAIARGLPWRRAANFSTVAYTGTGATDASNKLNTLLDEVATQNSAYWTIDGDGYVTAAVAATTPTWTVQPGLTDLGLAEDDYVSDLSGRRLTSGGTFEVVKVGDPVARAAFGRKEAPVDLTRLGVVSNARAQQILQGILAKGKGRPSFTTALELSSAQLLTIGGTPADLTMVRAGQVVRSPALFDDIAYLNGRTYLDWLIGETSYVAGADVITVTPAGLSPRDLGAIIAGLGEPVKFAA